jgi:hypothetical protein
MQPELVAHPAQSADKHASCPFKGQHERATTVNVPIQARKRGPTFPRPKCAKVKDEAEDPYSYDEIVDPYIVQTIPHRIGRLFGRFNIVPFFTCVHSYLDFGGLVLKRTAGAPGEPVRFRYCLKLGV